MASLVPNRMLYNALHTYLNGKSLKAMLMKSTHTPSKDHNTVSDVVADEINVSGYARQTVTVSGSGVTEDDTNDLAKFDGTDPVFAALTTGQTVGGAWVFADSGADATSELICFLDGTDVPTNGGAITLVFDAAGIMDAISS